MPDTGSSIGTIHPFVAAQAAKHDYPLSFLNERFTDVAAWKREARRKFLDLLLYAPERVEPQPETLERVDCGDFWRERVTFRTAPEIRVPAYALIPKHAKLPAPGIVALHDHGGFYLWGKEKLVELPEEHAALSEFKKQYYGSNSIAGELARQGVWANFMRASEGVIAGVRGADPHGFACHPGAGVLRPACGSAPRPPTSWVPAAVLRGPGGDPTPFVS